MGCRRMGWFWPRNSSVASALGHNEKPLARGGVAKISSNQSAVFDVVGQLAKRLKELHKQFALLRLKRLAVCAERSPRHELFYVLNDHRLNVKLRAPFQDEPRRGP